MARQFEILEWRNSIRISVGEDLPAWARILAGFLPAAAVLLVGRPLFGNWTWIVALSAAVAMFATARGSRIDLDVTHVEFLMRGNSGRRGSRATRVVCSGDVQGLEFRDSLAQRSGLYALTSGSAQCVLPLVTYSEAMAVIAVIQKRFPGLAEAWQLKAGDSKHFPSLGPGKMK